MTVISKSNNNDQSCSGADRMGISIRDMVQVLAVIVLWTICYPLITTGLAAFPPSHFATLRSLLAGACLLAAGIAFNRPLIPGRSTWLSLIIVSFTFTALGFTGMFLAGGRVTPGLATVIANVQPLLAAVLGYFVLREQLTGARGFVLLTGFASIVVITIPGLLGQQANSTSVGVGLVLAGAVGVALGNVLLKRIASQIDPLIGMAWILLLGAIPLVIGISFYNERLSAIEWIGVAIVIVAVLLANRSSTQSLQKSLINSSANTSGSKE